MTWKDTIRKRNTNIQGGDFTVLPKGLKEYEGEFSTVESMAESRRTFDDYTVFNNVLFKRELKELVSTLKRLNINLSFSALVDERYDGEHNDGLYNWDEKSGLGVKVQMGDLERKLYFIIETEGAWTEEGGRPDVFVPRVLEDEDTFIAVILQSLNIGGGPVKNPASSIKQEERDEYAEWWYSLPRSEREDPDSNYPPPVFDWDYRGPRGAP